MSKADFRIRNSRQLSSYVFTPEGAAPCPILFPSAPPDLAGCKAATPAMCSRSRAFWASKAISSGVGPCAGPHHRRSLQRPKGLATDRPDPRSSPHANRRPFSHIERRILRSGHLPAAVAECDRNAGLPSSSSILRDGMAPAVTRQIASASRMVAVVWRPCCAGRANRRRCLCADS
jgi:hypothetical protein